MTAAPHKARWTFSDPTGGDPALGGPVTIMICGVCGVQKGYPPHIDAPLAQQPDGTWQPAEPIPYRGWKARLSQQLRAWADRLDALDEAGLG